MKQEVEETARKIAWDTVLEGLENDKKHFIYKKGTPAPKDIMEATLCALDGIAEQTFESIKDSTALMRHLRLYDKSTWSRTLQSLTEQSRFLACDKNLGVRLVSNVIYEKLAKRESANYETSKPHSPDLENRIIIALKKDLDAVAATVNTARIPNRRFNAQMVDVVAILARLAVFIRETSQGASEKYKLPRIRLLLKIHKKLGSDGLNQTRPIIPNCGLPGYTFSKWLGSFTARLAKTIPWNLTSTKEFTTWLTDRTRGSIVATFDFSNLYGNEPVYETITLFRAALSEMPWDKMLQNTDDKVIFKSLMQVTKVPDHMKSDLRSDTDYIFVILMMECVRQTLAILDTGKHDLIIATSRFLAMGCPPVAPLSIITLAYLESRKLGFDKCTKGMKRLIDDIIIDTSVISEVELRSCYPTYLQLNPAENGQFLDVQYVWNGSAFATWPFIKPHVTIPLNYNSFHPYHTIRAAAKNELLRLTNLVSLPQAKYHWVHYWFVKYSAAEYPESLLLKLIKETNRGRTLKEAKQRDINHMELWRGCDTRAGQRMTARMQNKSICTAWKVGESLMTMALKAHSKRMKHRDANFVNDENEFVDFSSTVHFKLFTKKSPEDASTVQGWRRKASGTKSEWR